MIYSSPDLEGFLINLKTDIKSKSLKIAWLQHQPCTEYLLSMYGYTKIDQVGS